MATGSRPGSELEAQAPGRSGALLENPDSDLGALDALSSGSVDALGSQPVQRVRWPDLIDAPPRRSVLPALALLGSAAAVLAALFVVMANRPPRRTTAVEPPGLAASPSRGNGARVQKLRPSEPYRAALRPYERDLRHCTREHGEHGEAFPVDAEAVIVVGVNGRAKHVSLRPETAESSALGGCIRGVLQDVSFPTAATDMEVAVGLAVYR